MVGGAVKKLRLPSWPPSFPASKPLGLYPCYAAARRRQRVSIADWGLRDADLEVRRQRSDDRDQMTDDRGQKTRLRSSSFAAARRRQRAEERRGYWLFANGWWGSQKTAIVYLASQPSGFQASRPLSFVLYPFSLCLYTF